MKLSPEGDLPMQVISGRCRPAGCFPAAVQAALIFILLGLAGYSSLREVEKAEPSLIKTGETPASQVNFDRFQVLELLEASHFEEAVPLLEPHAGNGERLAQLWLGFIYAGGAGVERDEDASARWMARAAEAGSSMARAWLQQTRSALIPASGWALEATREFEPLPASLVTADDQPLTGVILALNWPNLRRWNEAALARDMPFSRYNLAQASLFLGDLESHRTFLRAAAENGHIKAMNQLSLYAELGVFGEPQNSEAAEAWRLRAAEAGDVDQQWTQASRLLREGNGHAPDYRAALPWLEKAAAQDHREALIRLGRILRDGSAGPVDDTRARALFLRAVALGYPNASVYAAHMLHSGRGGPRDSQRAMELLRQSASDENAWVLFHLGQAVREGWAAAPDLDAGQKIWERAAELGSTNAQTALADVFYVIKSPTSLARAFEYAEMAAREGNDWAQNRVGWMLLQGEGIAADTAEASHWFRLAADKGNTTAMANLAHCYRHGLGVSRDQSQMEYWMRKSSTGKDEVARVAVIANLITNVTDEAKARELLAELASFSRSSDRAVASQARIFTAYILAATKIPGLSKPVESVAELKSLLPDQEARLALVALAANPATRELLPPDEIATLARETFDQGDIPQRLRLVMAMLVSKDAPFVAMGLTYYRKAVEEDGSFKTKFEELVPRAALDPQQERPVTQSGDTRPPALRRNVVPMTPAVMLAANISGTASIRFVASNDGTVTEAEIVSASEPEFGEAARDAVRQWIFWPALKNGRPVSARMQIPINFNLEDAPP